MYFVLDVTINVYFILHFMLSLQVRILSVEEGSALNSGLVAVFVRTEKAELCSNRKYSEDGSYFTRRRLFDITNIQRH